VGINYRKKTIFFRRGSGEGEGNHEESYSRQQFDPLARSNTVEGGIVSRIERRCVVGRGSTVQRKREAVGSPESGQMELDKRNQNWGHLKGGIMGGTEKG